MAMELQDPSPNALPIFQTSKTSIPGIRWSLDLGVYLMFGSWCLELSSVPVEQLRDFAMPAPCRPGQRRRPWRIVGPVRLRAALQKQLDHGNGAPRSQPQCTSNLPTSKTLDPGHTLELGPWSLSDVWILVLGAFIRAC